MSHYKIFQNIEKDEKTFIFTSEGKCCVDTKIKWKPKKPTDQSKYYQVNRDSPER
jgi:hypothetical protein